MLLYNIIISSWFWASSNTFHIAAAFQRTLPMTSAAATSQARDVLRHTSVRQLSFRRWIYNSSINSNSCRLPLIIQPCRLFIVTLWGAWRLVQRRSYYRNVIFLSRMRVYTDTTQLNSTQLNSTQLICALRRKFQTVVTQLTDNHGYEKSLR
jgi:hypothetical protein